MLTGARAPGGGAGRRPVVQPDRRLDPGRQDPDGAPGRRPGGLRPALPHRRHARRGRQGDPRVDRGDGGGGLRRGAGGDGRRRPVRDRRRRAWSTRSCCSRWPAPATSCRASRRASWSWPTSIAVNKADGPHERDARAAARELAGALRLMHGRDAAWTPPVLDVQRPRVDRPGHRLGPPRTAPHAARRRRRARRQAPRPAGRLDVDDGPRRTAGPPARRPRRSAPSHPG